MDIKKLFSKDFLETVAALIAIVGVLYASVQYLESKISEKIRVKSFVINILSSNNIEEYDETLNMWNINVSEFGKDAFNSSEKAVLYDALLFAAANSRTPYKFRGMIKDFPTRYDFVLQQTSFRSHQLGWLDMMSDDCRGAVLKYRESIRLAGLDESRRAIDGYRGLFYCALSMGDAKLFDESRGYLVNAYYEGDKDLAREVFFNKGTYMYSSLDSVSGKVFSTNVDAYISSVRNNNQMVLTARSGS